jgi:hypothetical protein
MVAPAGELERIAGMSSEDELRVLRQQEVALNARLKQTRRLISGLDRRKEIRQGGKIR